MTDMSLSQAKEIVSAINNRAMVTVGIDVSLPELRNISLSDMLEAKLMVQEQNKREKESRQASGTYTISVVPDDRLIAAVYAITHFPPSEEPILNLPYRHLFGDRIALAVLSIDSADEHDPEEA